MPRFRVVIECNGENEKHLRRDIKEVLQDHGDLFFDKGELVAIVPIAGLEPKKKKKSKLQQQPPNGWVFLRDDEHDMDDDEDAYERFFLTPIELWRKNGYIDDSVRDFPKLPEDFRECQEACFEYSGDGDPIEILESLGFQEVEWGEKV